jgi:dTDP-D-glucose 4,6-dehydratase
MSNKSPRRLLVTGGAGFIGSNFVELAVQAGHWVTVLDSLTYAGHPENLKGVRGPGHFDLVMGDIRDSGLVARLLKEHQIDGVLNFAAESHVDRSISGPSLFIETNIQGIFNLLETSLQYWKTLEGTRKENFRYLQVSTDEVFGALGPTGKFSETSPYAPNSPYSASKAAADHLVRAWYHTDDQLNPRNDGKTHRSGIQFVQDRLGHDRRYAIDNSFVQKELGFKPEFNFEEGLVDTIHWYLSHSEWLEMISHRTGLLQ